MCLYANTNLHGSGTSFSPKIAKVPLLVWKSLEQPDAKGAYSPFLCYRWTFGKTVNAKLHVDYETTNSIAIEDGLHAHILNQEQRQNKALVSRYVAPNKKLWSIFGKLYPAVIPAGTKFVIGKEGDIVAEAMTVYRDEEHMFTALGITKLADGIKRETIKTW
jgi:hypothetical protein